jgi:hypothetical protein
MPRYLSQLKGAFVAAVGKESLIDLRPTLGRAGRMLRTKPQRFVIEAPPRDRSAP